MQPAERERMNLKGCTTYGAKEDAAVRAWDARRGPWKVLFHLEAADGSGAYLNLNGDIQTLQMRQTTRFSIDEHESTGDMRPKRRPLQDGL